MPDGMHFLSDGDVETLRALIKSYNERPLERVRPEDRTEVGQSPEIYVAITGLAGIPARIGLNPGKADCQIYQLPLNEGLIPIGTSVKTVYNLSSSEIPGDTFLVILRTRNGSFVAATAGAGGSASFQTAAVLKEFDDYLWCILYDFQPGAGGSGSGSGSDVYSPNRGRLIVSNASWTGGTTTFTTTTAHGLSTGSRVEVDGVNPSTFNGTFTVTGTPTPTTFDVAMTNPGVYGNCGTVIDLDLTLYVAKPPLLQRTPWDQQIAPQDTGRFTPYAFYEYGSTVASASIASAGEGYTDGDVLTLVGGTCCPPAIVSISASGGGSSGSGGPISGLSLISGGFCTSDPSSPAETLGGTGTGATVSFILQSALGVRRVSAVVPMAMDSCTFVGDGSGGVLFSSQGPYVLQFVTPPYLQGDVIFIDPGETGLIDPNGSSIEFTDANNGGRTWQDNLPNTIKVRLTAKDTSVPGSFIVYSWQQVLDSDQPNPLTYGNYGLSGGPGSMPLYHLRNIDLPVGFNEIYEISLGARCYYTFNNSPRTEICDQTSATPDALGYFPGDIALYTQGVPPAGGPSPWSAGTVSLLVDATSS